MKIIYFNILEMIQRLGHEVGLHGLWHEYLSDLNKEEQRKLIKAMINDFEGEVSGANFIGRMNKDTLRALVENGIKYFVHPMIHRYNFTGYLKLPTTPSLFILSNKKIWMLPVSVETYNSPYLSIKNMIDSAIWQGKKSKFLHISILCHPFRDGNLAHIKTTEKILYYLTIKKRLRPITLKELIDKLSENKVFSSILSMKDLFRPKRTRITIPRIKQDFSGMIPENLMVIYRIIKKGHSIF